MTPRSVAASFVLAVCVLPLHAEAPKDKIGATYGRAQVAEWVSPGLFAVGRWDGTVTLFRPPSGGSEFGPVAVQALVPPSGRGVEMLARIGREAFVTSNDGASLAVWESREGRFVCAGTVPYDAKYGTADSGTLVVTGGERRLVAGHSEGYLTVWDVRGCDVAFRNGIDLRSGNPIPPPFGTPMWNVRSVVRHRGDVVVTGAEDGDVCLVRVPDGAVLSRTRYSPDAKRGINSLSVDGDSLLLANCSVGRDDKNLWLYEIKDGRISPVASANLIKDAGRPQVFNFDVQFVPRRDRRVFFASTEEGLLWRGEVVGGAIKVAPEPEKVACEGGAALAFDAESGVLAAAAHDVLLYKPAD